MSHSGVQPRDEMAVEELLAAAQLELDRDADAAALLAQSAAERATADGDPLRAGSAFQLQGQALFSQAQHMPALAAYRRARREFGRAGDIRRVADVYRREMAAHAMRNDRARAYAAARAARLIYREQDDDVALAKLMVNSATMMHRFGRHGSAVKRYREALSFFAERNMVLESSSVALNLANVLSLMDRQGEAESLYRSATESFEREGRPREAAQAQYNLAYLHYLQGRCREALDGLDRAQAFFASVKDPFHVALCHLDRAEMYLELGLMPEAVSQAAAAMAGFEPLQLDNEATRARLFHDLARLELGYERHADENLAAAASQFERLENPAWAATIYLHLAMRRLQCRELDSAQSLAERALSVFERAPLPSNAARARLVLSSIEAERGDADAARRHLHHAIESSRQDRSPWIEVRARLALAQLEPSLEQALHLVDRALVDLETLHASAPGGNWEETLAGDRERVYAEAVRLSLAAVTPSKPETLGRAFLYAERARSRSALERLMRPHELAADQIASSEQGRQLVSSLGRTRQERWYVDKTVRRLERESADASRIARLLRTSDRLARRDAALRQKLANFHHQAAELHDLVAPSPDQLLEHLPQRATLVEYAITGDSIVAFRLDRRGLALHRLNANRNDILRHLHSLQFHMNKLQLGENYAQRHASALLAATTQHLGYLGSALLEQVMADCPDAERLIIAPHGALHYVPFHALRVKGTYVIDEHEVSTIPSASVLRLCSQRGSRVGTGSLVVGISHPTTPSVDVEVERVARLLPDSTLLRDHDATWARVRELARGCQYLHVSTHGMVRPDNPMASSLRLADRWISYVDARQLQLNAELVVIAACHAGVDRLISGDELLGLGRVLLESGANALVTTLWAVQDESIAEWMTDFYELRLQGSAIPAAFRSACLAARRRNPHPAYWAPCTLIGALDGDQPSLAPAEKRPTDDVTEGPPAATEHRRMER